MRPHRESFTITAVVGEMQPNNLVLSVRTTYRANATTSVNHPPQHGTYRQTHARQMDAFPVACQRGVTRGQNPSTGKFFSRIVVHSFILFQTTEVHRRTHNTYIYRKKDRQRETETKHTHKTRPTMSLSQTDSLLAKLTLESVSYTHLTLPTILRV